MKVQAIAIGVKPTGSIFQSVIDQILNGIDFCVASIDDILNWGRDHNELRANFKKILDRLSKFNVKVNFDKYKWFVDEVKYLGYIISKEGI
jgi:hypothetical protein